MYSPEGLCPEALVDHNGHCVPQQLSKLLKTPLETIEAEIDTHLTDWRGVGVPTDAIAKIAGKRGTPLYVMHNGRKIKEHKPESSYKKGCLAYSIEGAHALFLRIRTGQAVHIAPCRGQQWQHRHDKTAASERV